MVEHGVDAGTLETKLHSMKLLESPMEYKQALSLYVKKFANEGFCVKGEELIKGILVCSWFCFIVGLYLRLDRRLGRHDGWCPIFISIPKHNLLKMCYRFLVALYSWEQNLDEC